MIACMSLLTAAVLSAASLCEETDLQKKAQELADYAVREGLQGALQFCAFKDGKCIIDVHAGTMTTNAGAAKIDGNTLFPIFSTEKPLLATAVHRTVEQGKLTYDTPVAKVWPEFKGGGKERLTVRELLGYRSGMPDGAGKMGFSPEGTRVMSDWKTMLDWFASVSPDIVPGTKQRYMAKSYGWAHGGLLEKVWRRPANEILREQVLIPAGIENDFYFICGDAEIPRIATVYKSGAFESMNDDLARRSFLPSAWAVSSARGLAQFYNRLCGFDGQPPLLKGETLDEALKPCRHPSDPVPDAEGLKNWHMIFGMGYGLWGGADDLSRVFGHGGVGGSEGLCDRSQRIAVGYTCNFDQAPPKLREAFYSLAGIRWRYWSQDVNIQDLQMATMRPDSVKHGMSSIASFCERAEGREPLTVAFFGGSLTWGANATDPNITSWRGRICERLRTTYPNTPFRFIDAAIGGTGSELGVFRLERDVLKFKPDLMFHEWSVNDGFAYSNDNASCSYEGIIRRVLAEAPGCVPVPVILPDRKTMTIEPMANLHRRAEHLAIAERYNLNVVDVLGTLRKIYVSGKDETDLIWPVEIGDNTHPHDYGYGVYADIIWDAVFAHPSDRVPKLTPEPMFPPKYAHVCRQRLNAFDWLPEGWAKGYNAMRAGTFDFLCSRRQDGIVRATNKGGKNPSPFRLRFCGEVLLLYGESTVKSGNCEIWVDGRRAATRDCSDFGTWFAPSAYLLWPITANLDPEKIHELEIRPILKDGEVQEINIESVCVAGRHGAWVRQMSEPKVSVDGCARVRLADDCVLVSSTGAVSFVRIKWPHEMPRETLVLNDAWERSYGDLEWKSLAETRVSPWYFLASVSNRTWGVGVETDSGAMCCWEVTTNGTTLVLDLRAGGQPVRLSGRTLKACRIVRAESREGESAWAFGRRFCRMMCPKPKLPKAPVYGYNDWYCAYGKNTATNFLADAAYIMECAKGCANPPYVVMDDGWQRNSPPVVHESGRGPWDAAGPNFGMDMPTFCRRIAALGAKPGLWYRPLRAWDELPEEQRLLENRDYLDPTVPAVKARIVEDMRRFRNWGFKLVKIDFLSYDLAQLWPCDPHLHYDRYIQDARIWRDSSRTTAEVMRDLYRAMKDAVGDDVVIIGCNAFNHLAAGVFELQRTGCDTSGKKWSWTRDHGVNTLAMRSIQDGAFFKLDADCVGLAEKGAVPWELNRQWMDLLGRSGTPFFVSWRRQLAGPEVRNTLAEAFRRASSERPVIEPVDWQRMRTPNQWRDAEEIVNYEWE